MADDPHYPRGVVVDAAVVEKELVVWPGLGEQEEGQVAEGRLNLAEVVEPVDTPS